MTKQAAFSLQCSAAAHVGGVLALLAWTTALPEGPHYHVRRGVIEIQASFAAAAPPATTEIAFRPVPAEPLSPVTELAPTPLDLAPVRAALRRLPDAVQLPAELEACDCPEPEHALQTPKRRSAPEFVAAEAPQAAPMTRQVAAAAELEVATEVTLPADAAPDGVEADEPPQKLANNRPPPYPAEAYRARQQGRVLLEVRITPAGTVATVRVIESSGVASLDQSALDTVATWRFAPARLRGLPVEATVNVPVRFTIRGP